MVQGAHGPVHMHAAVASTPQASGGGGRSGSDTRRCRMSGCAEPLPPGYHTKYRICRHHCQLASQEVDGETVRFCQQCGRFQLLDEFDAALRSCRVSLSQHKKRRQLARRQHAEDDRHSGGAAPAGEGAAEGPGKRGRQRAEQEEQPHSRQKAAPQPRQPQLQPVLPAKLPCAVYVTPLQPLQPLPQPPPGHRASSVHMPAQQLGLPPAVPSQASGTLLTAWQHLANASHASGSARVLLQPVAPAVPGVAGSGATAGLPPSPAHQVAHGPGICMPPLPAPLDDPQPACATMINMMEASPSLDLILAISADLGLELSSQWWQPPAGVPRHADFERQEEEEPPHQQEDHHKQPQQQRADGLQLASRWNLAGTRAAPAQPCHWELAGSGGECRQPVAAALPAHTANSADSTSAAQLQAGLQFAGAGDQGANAQPSSAHEAPPVPPGTAASQTSGMANAQRRRTSRTGPSQPGQAEVRLPAAPAAPTLTVHTNYRPVALCPASDCPDMGPPSLHPDDRLYLQQLSLSLSEGYPPLEFQSSTSVGYGEWGCE